MIKKLLVVTMLIAVSACATLQKELGNYVAKPKVSYQSISIGEVTMDRLQLIPVFKVANDNNFPIPINTIAYALSLNNKQLLAGETNQIGTLAANDTKEITLAIDLTQETLLSAQQLLFKNKQVSYQIKGYVNALGVTIPFEESAMLYVPEIKIRDLQVMNANFERINFVISIDIENKNDFSFPLEDISYSLSSKGRKLFDGGLTQQKIGKGIHRIQIPLNIKPKDLFSNFFTMLLTPELPLHLEIKSPLFNKSYDNSINLSTFFNTL